MIIDFLDKFDDKDKEDIADLILYSILLIIYNSSIKFKAGGGGGFLGGLLSVASSLLGGVLGSQRIEIPPPQIIQAPPPPLPDTTSDELTKVRTDTTRTAEARKRRVQASKAKNLLFLDDEDSNSVDNI